jgi:3-oxosteroid 1-dehydrogenase
MLRTLGKRLVTDAKGDVIGIHAISDGSWLTIRARRAVIIATGGFEYNEELKRHYLRGPTYVSITLPPGNPA